MRAVTVLGEEILEEDEVGGLRVDVVGAEQVELLFALGEVVVDGGRGLLIYGLGGIIAPFIGIKIIDVVINLVGAV